jgi:hypothetical protein
MILELLTNAMYRLSGDHEGTLMVPCPPYKWAKTLGDPPVDGMSFN